MRIKVNGEYLDFNGSIEIEKKFKLLETIDSSGDFSYAIELQTTKNNLRILGLSDLNSIDKKIYKKLPCAMENSSGFSVYTGILQVQRITDVIESTFFSGDSNWIGEVQGDCINIDLRQYGIEQTAANIAGTWTKTEGVVFPLIDVGILSERSKSNANPYPILLVEDFRPAIYLKTVFHQLFLDYQIKLKGELLSDALYNSMVLTSNTVNGSQDLLNSNSSRANKTTLQTLGPGLAKVTYTDVGQLPNFAGLNYDSTNSEWVASEPMVIDVTATTIHGAIIGADIGIMGIFINGVQYSYLSFSLTGETKTSVSYTDIVVAAGDVITINAGAAFGTYNFTGGYFSVSVKKLVTIIPQTLLGGMSKVELISSVFKMFNVVTNYDKHSKTLTLNLFRNIKSKEPIELTGEIVEINFSDLVADYGQSTSFIMNESELSEISNYNKINDTPYGGGVLEIDNDYIEKSVEIEVSLTPGYAYQNDTISGTVLKFPFFEFAQSTEEFSITSVTNSGGFAVFHTGAAHGYAVGDYVKILNSSTNEYQGVGRVFSVPSSTSFRLAGVTWGGVTMTGSVAKMDKSENDVNSCFCFLNIPNVSLDKVSYISGVTLQGDVTSTSYTSMAFGYASLPFDQNLIYENLRYSLFFNNPNVVGVTQFGLIENYYRELREILNNPVSVILDSYISEKKFLELSALNPVRFDTEKISGLFYLNRITGYEDSKTPCEVELIKM